MGKKSLYEQHGVDPHKGTVKQAFRRIARTDFPQAFCKIIRDPMNPKLVIGKHADGSGSKSVQRVLYFLETGDRTIFRADPYDAFSMNTGDLASSGFLGPYIVTDTIGINSLDLPKDLILSQIAAGMSDLKSLYANYGIEVIFLGGETADLPDQVNSYVLDMDIFARAKEEDIIKGDIKPGDVIYGFSSAGRAAWEPVVNSGIMSNGLTLARKSLMSGQYAIKYPFLCHPDKPFAGKFNCASMIGRRGGAEGLSNVSRELLSPTRQWAIVIKMIIDELKQLDSLHLLHGISMNTGGGATKISNIGKGITYKKEMPACPPVFKLIQRESKEVWKNMFTTFNMGVGIDVVGSPALGILQTVCEHVSRKTRLELFELGRCSKSRDGKNHVKLFTTYGSFKY